MANRNQPPYSCPKERQFKTMEDKIDDLMSQLEKLKKMEMVMQSFNDQVIPKVNKTYKTMFEGNGDPAIMVSLSKIDFNVQEIKKQFRDYSTTTEDLRKTVSGFTKFQTEITTKDSVKEANEQKIDKQRRTITTIITIAVMVVTSLLTLLFTLLSKGGMKL